ncbi:hypothetical protein VTK73DRAFT_4487 [Phialemonium thermophilum]|uniref:Uncharacterized protein n=1 Tax=Phialemonium thermophilum TaxID=223376 RepID=A0ABR3V9E8_9PEZI
MQAPDMHLQPRRPGLSDQRMAMKSLRGCPAYPRADSTWGNSPSPSKPHYRPQTKMPRLVGERAGISVNGTVLVPGSPFHWPPHPCQPIPLGQPSTINATIQPRYPPVWPCCRASPSGGVLDGGISSPGHLLAEDAIHHDAVMASFVIPPFADFLESFLPCKRGTRVFSSLAASNAGERHSPIPSTLAVFPLPRRPSQLRGKLHARPRLGQDSTLPQTGCR